MIRIKKKGSMDDVVGIFFLVIIVGVIVWFFIYVQNKADHTAINDEVTGRLNDIKAAQYLHLYLRTPVSSHDPTYTYYDLIIESYINGNYSELKEKSQGYVSMTSTFHRVWLSVTHRDINDYVEKLVTHDPWTIFGRNTVAIKIPLPRNKNNHDSLFIRLDYCNKGEPMCDPPPSGTKGAGAGSPVYVK